MNDYTKPKSSLDLGDVKKETPTVNSMLEGPLKTKKKSAFEKFSEDFFSGDAKTIKEYAVKDVLIPSFKRMISTLVSNAVDILLFGEARGNKNFPDGRPNKYSYTSYSSYYDGGSQIKTRSINTKPILPQREDYRKWVFTENDAKRALLFLRTEIENYDRVSLSKLYQFCGKHWSPADENYGWFDLSTADWHYDIDADGYILELPSPEPII